MELPGVFFVVAAGAALAAGAGALVTVSTALDAVYLIKVAK